jgi:hypothetical protein
VQFAQAFGHKRILTGEDEKVLNFLMGQGEEKVSASVALLITKHSDKKRAERFLIDCLAAFPHNRTNFLQALSFLVAPESASPVLNVLEECKTKLADNNQDYESITDLIYCSAVLFKLLHQSAYREQIASYLQHPLESIRTAARLCLDELPPGTE